MIFSETAQYLLKEPSELKHLVGLLSLEVKSQVLLIEKLKHQLVGCAAIGLDQAPGPLINYSSLRMMRKLCKRVRTHRHGQSITRRLIRNQKAKSNVSHCPKTCHIMKTFCRRAKMSPRKLNMFAAVLWPTGLSAGASRARVTKPFIRLHCRLAQ
jgi:hypothetical protein